MPFCPECRDEFEDGVEACPGCGVVLVPELPKKTIPSTVYKLRNDPLVYATTAPNEPVAGFWRGILEDNGIKCVLKSDNLRAAQYVLWLNHWHEIWVLKSDLRTARALLKPLNQSLLGVYPYYGERGIPLIARVLLGAVIFLLAGTIEGAFISTATLWYLIRQPESSHTVKN